MNLVTLHNVIVVENARYTPAKKRPDGSTVDSRLWFRVKESELEGGWYNIWPVCLWGAQADALKDQLVKDATIDRMVTNCKVTYEKDDAGHWSSYIELRVAKGKDGTVRSDCIGTVSAPVAETPVAQAQSGSPDMAVLLAALGPQGMALLAQLAAQVGAPQAPKAAPVTQVASPKARTSPASEMDGSFFSDPGESELEDSGDSNPFA